MVIFQYMACGTFLNSSSCKEYVKDTRRNGVGHSGVFFKNMACDTFLNSSSCEEYDKDTRRRGHRGVGHSEKESPRGRTLRWPFF